MSWDDYEGPLAEAERAAAKPHLYAQEGHGPGECDCHCERCGEPLELDPIYGLVYGGCGDCDGGRVDGEAFRGREASEFERERQARIQRELK
jgi:hypothetical protein